MSKPKHTPAPWVVRNRADVMTENGACRADGERAADNDAWNICHYQNDAPTRVEGGKRWEGLPRDEADANLALIAASPSLLVALEAMVRTFGALADVGEPGPDRHARTEALALAEKTIQEARGES